MTLDTYCTALDREQLAKLAVDLGIHPESLARYRRTGRVPKPEFVGKIARLTRGLVMPNDFFPCIDEPKAAE